MQEIWERFKHKLQECKSSFNKKKRKLGNIKKLARKIEIKFSLISTRTKKGKQVVPDLYYAHAVHGLQQRCVTFDWEV